MAAGRAFATVGFLLVALTTSSGCAAATTLEVRPGDDHQARILSFDGVPFDQFVGRRPSSGHYRVSLRPGEHQLRVVVPGPCATFDGRPGPGSSVSNLRFTAKQGGEYQVSLAFFPTQLFTEVELHVYEMVKAPNEVRAVEEVISREPDRDSCPRNHW